ncbi:MAG: HAMP domain-containing histidine kinase [Marinifilaceae bacterium]|nr:HAMP domain-containing histidine kinase [Marinifilaceae bacterium]
MKKNIFTNSYSYLFISIILLLVSVFISYYNTNVDVQYKYTKHCQETINRYEEEIDNVISDFEKDFIGSKDSLNNLLHTVESRLERHNTYIQVYKESEIIYWSNYGFEFRREHISSPVHKIASGIYILKKYMINDLELWTFHLVAKQYSIVNKFFKDEISEEFDVPTNFSFIYDSPEKNAIYNSSGDYLFSLARIKIAPGENISFNYITYLYLFGIMFFMLFGLLKFTKASPGKMTYLFFIAFAFAFIAFRYIMLAYNFPKQLYSYELFSPQLFASSNFIPSLGDLLLNSLCVIYLMFLYSSVLNNYIDRANTRIRLILLGLNLLFLFIIGNLAIDLIENIINDSSLDLLMYTSYDNKVFIFVAYLIISIILFTATIQAKLVSKIIFVSKDFILKYKKFLIVAAIFFIVGLIYFEPNVYKLLLMFILSFSYLPQLFKKEDTFYIARILLMLLLAVFASFLINQLSTKNEKLERYITASNLSTEIDFKAESLLNKLSDRLIQDKTLGFLCNSDNLNEQRITSYLRNKYFSGYWENYDLSITCCSYVDELKLNATDSIQNCYEFFIDIINQDGEETNDPNFFLINDFDGLVSYIGIIPFENRNLYVELISRIEYRGIGYPDLLNDDSNSRSGANRKYSYAKYKKGQLLMSSGRYNYNFNINAYTRAENQHYYIEKDNYTHLIYELGDENVVIVSKKKINWSRRTVAIPFIFIFLFILSTLVNFSSSKILKKKTDLSFRYRIQIPYIILLMLFFCIISGGTIYYSLEKEYNRNEFELREKVNYVKSVFVDNPDLLNSYYELNNKLIDLSNQLYADIHLYNNKAELMATSRSEIFIKELQSRRMNYKAYTALKNHKKSNYIHNESIGEAKYISLYEPITSRGSEIIAYVNIPYFTRSSEIKMELFDFVLAGVNLNIIIIIIAISTSVFISNRITQPLRLIQKRIKETKLGAKSETMVYHRNDEIGSLVNEYNQMLLKLEESAKLLAKSERESAWREMARQIAHEIKNPLTPMKLSIQFMQRQINSGGDDWKEKIESLSQSLINQINNLADIASAFSDFAKLTESNLEESDIVDIVKNSIQIYSNETWDVSYETNVDTAICMVDKSQIHRAFVNLITNGIQATPKDKNVVIKIKINKTDKNTQISFIDNGTGIEESLMPKLFVPNFTTKNSGTGLGLAIVKSIIENCNGEIEVETEIGKGSVFHVYLPNLI